MIFAGSVLLTSAKFDDGQNGVKWFFLTVGLLAWFVLSLLFVKDLKALSEVLFIPRLLAWLFAIGTLQSFDVLAQYFGFLPSNHDLLKVTGTFENPAGAV